MFGKTSIWLLVISVLLIITFIYFFTHLFVYLVISIILSLIGRPFMKIFDKLRYKRIKLPRAISALMSLVISVGLISIIISIIVPLLSSQAQVISKIDFGSVLNHYREPLNELKSFLVQNEIIKKGDTFESAITEQFSNVVNFATFKSVFSFILSATGSIFIGFFSILFFTFYMLYDESLYSDFINWIIPHEFRSKFRSVVSEILSAQSSYFKGIGIEVLTMMVLISFSLWVIGVKNAFLIGFLGGLLNIIPYVGPLIGMTLGTILTLSTNLSNNEFDLILRHSMVVPIVFLGANLIDNFLLQPLIYGNSVKAKPIEIFLVISMGGSLGGVSGMIIAIPTYMIIRIIAREVLAHINLKQRSVALEVYYRKKNYKKKEKIKQFQEYMKK
ncbi:MAG: AI-2E family transporter [Hyphomicrobiales bacterium]